MNKKKLKRYRLKINPDNGSMVDFISQVEKPAIEVDFLKFNKQTKLESIKDYPKGISDTAQKVLNYVEKNGWGSCGTNVGKTRASQLAKGEAISLDTVKRMYSYLSRHKVDLQSSKTYADGCGKLMYDAWGGDAALSWSERYINQQENMDEDSSIMDIDIFGYKTLNFDMCPGAQAQFKTLTETTMSEETMGMIRSAAQIADNVFRIEKDVIDEGEATRQQMIEAEILVKDFSDVMNEISKDLDMTLDTSYMMGHIEKISSYLNPEMMKDFVDACWEDYEPVGFKIVDGKRVPNCVPVKKSSHLAQQVNNDKMEVFGPVLIPDLPIYRQSENMGEYEIIFKADDIKDIEKHFMKSGFQNNINLDHSDTTANSYVFESFISDELVKNPEPYKDLPLGTWFVRMKVDDPEVWSDIKTGKRKGFSIEGMFEYLVEEFEKSYFEKQNSQSTNNIYTSVEDKNELENMIKDLFRKIFVDLAQELDEKPVESEGLSDYQMVSSADYKIEAREVGQKVEMVGMDDMLVPAPDGMYEFEDGFKFTVTNGVISSIDGQDQTEVESAEAEDLTNQYLDMLKKYPWDQCIADMEKQGYDMETANKICGSIRWQNQEKQESDMNEELKSQIEEIKANMITKEQILVEIQSVKEEFKTIFEKFAKLPAEPSRVAQRPIVKDDNKAKFESFLNSIRKAND